MGDMLESQKINDRNFRYVLREVEEKVRAELFCCECGSTDGMMRYMREFFSQVGLGVELYWIMKKSTHHDVYQPCWQCNSHRIIPSSYTQIDILNWLTSPCLCPECLNVKEK